MSSALGSIVPPQPGTLMSAVRIIQVGPLPFVGFFIAMPPLVGEPALGPRIIVDAATPL
jgi:hypothetical protein